MTGTTPAENLALNNKLNKIHAKECSWLCALFQDTIFDKKEKQAILRELIADYKESLKPVTI